MKWAWIISGCSMTICAAVLWGVAVQHARIVALRTDHRQLMEEQRSSPAVAAHERKSNQEPGDVPRDEPLASAELLRLRGSIAPLRERAREAAALCAENEKLRAEMAGRATNTSLYLYRFQAGPVGYPRPQDTLQSFLWAVEHHDITNVLAAFMPERAKEFTAGLQASRWEEGAFFRFHDALLGLGILNQTPLDDGSVELKVQTNPDEAPKLVRLRQINGEWKLDVHYVDLFRND